MNFRNVQLEMSLKPFRDDSEATTRAVCTELFRQWAPLCRHADVVSVMLWAADGSEILDYRSNLDDTFEWAYTIGVANPRGEKAPPDHPNSQCIHQHPYLYMDKPPVFTYRWLKRLIAVLKETGTAILGKPIRVGATFDPGPEFAKSAFKYERHPEICLGGTMGRASFVCCYATLHADSTRYAGYPNGIPESTPFGEFLGRQSKHFLKDMGYDYLWLSNGFGFGLETWGLRGAVFNGKGFSTDRVSEVRAKSIGFWDAFRRECPDVPLATRGTNFGTGKDLSSDAVPLREIYRGGYNIEPPPNSPWAAINSDFGLELTGWMSHIAELPGDGFLFRFYTHDPWFLNSPWFDRYCREPHDIYLPLSVARLDGKGEVGTPTSLSILTVDDSYGRMPEQVPNEVIPHILAARGDQPDRPGPLVWVYPFDEFHDWTFGTPCRIDEVFFNDWFMRGAVNQGLPLNTVISTGNAVTALASNRDAFAESALVSPVPQADSAWEQVLLQFAAGGGRVLLYGPLRHASAKLLKTLNLKVGAPLSGEFELTLKFEGDHVQDRPMATRLVHHPLLSAGGLEAVAANIEDVPACLLAAVSQDQATRVVAWTRSLREWNGGRISWVRGTVSCDPERTGGHLLVPLNPAETYPAEAMMRQALQSFGIFITPEKRNPEQPNPMLCVARRSNGFFLSGFTPDTTTAVQLRFPQGAPVLTNLETWVEGGRAQYNLPRAWHRECRVFIEQGEDGRVGCMERCSGMVGVSRRFLVTGLRNATVRFYYEAGTQGSVKMLRNPQSPYLAGEFLSAVEKTDALGHYLQADGVSGDVMISW
ncbi:MAG: hypothetical protein A3K19_26045 [Lentisphaerae bacterium RIFOXYB12_FULL_65_16]|nr:MAG: hypothetical protein A3K18_08715 [Lentisphaerae bacterium RIFOXYA12_64_32]OGV87730.1 MAG: hypothetical protein A3K19_26045 [Lentisphaerae bacterium RIFOXYB12_FULL_65_16]